MITVYSDKNKKPFIVTNKNKNTLMIAKAYNTWWQWATTRLSDSDSTCFIDKLTELNQCNTINIIHYNIDRDIRDIFFRSYVYDTVTNKIITKNGKIESFINNPILHIMEEVISARKHSDDS